MEKVIGIDIVADLAGVYRRLNKLAKGGLNSVLEICAQGSKAGSPECSTGASPRLVAINAAYRCSHLASASPGTCSAARIGTASAQASIS